MRLSLALVLLLVGGPGWNHAHAGGDRPHSHDAGQAATHSHHDAGHHDHSTHSDDCDSNSAGQALAHVHLTLWGFELTLPVESEEGDGDAGPSSYLATAPVSMEMAPAWAAQLAAAMFLNRADEPPTAEPVFRCITASIAPLCDAARHERTGVLLV